MIALCAVALSEPSVYRNAQRSVAIHANMKQPMLGGLGKNRNMPGHIYFRTECSIKN